jgi:hypothetical protein
MRRLTSSTLANKIAACSDHSSCIILSRRPRPRRLPPSIAPCRPKSESKPGPWPPAAPGRPAAFGSWAARGRRNRGRSAFQAHLRHLGADMGARGGGGRGQVLLWAGPKRGGICDSIGGGVDLHPLAPKFHLHCHVMLLHEAAFQ